MIKRVARLVIYSGEPSRVDVQLGRSLPDGVRPGGSGVQIQVITLSESLIEALESQAGSTREARQGVDGMCCMAAHATAPVGWTCQCPCHARKDGE